MRAWIHRIHPKNKQDAGARLANWALAEFYGKADVTATGPMYASHKIKGNTVTVQFTHAKDLQPDKNERIDIRGFALAGADKKWHWAQATLADDGQVRVTCAKVKKPAAVRYGWGDNPDCNLVNQAQLPTTPFRTDNW